MLGAGPEKSGGRKEAGTVEWVEGAWVKRLGGKARGKNEY